MAEIQIYASFPRKVVLGSDSPNDNVNINPSDWHWVHCLTFPLEEFNALQFSSRPYKWMRYAIGAIVGVQGDLSSNADADARNFELVNYDAADLPAEGAVLYYHTSYEERHRMFPVDSGTAARTSRAGSSDASSATDSTGRAQFREVVAQRDGNMCVLTGMGGYVCKAVHLLAHGKGDAYIASYTQHRSRDTGGSDIVQDVDSARNGLFLNMITRGVVGIHVAFLPTPNFAMTTSDVDPTLAPDEKRYTAHLFIPGEPAKTLFGGLRAPPSGTPLRMPDALHEEEWPPPTVFDGVYASTVLNHFGTQTIKDELAANWTYADKIPVDERALEEKRKRAQERKARRGLDTFDMLRILPYIAVPPEERPNVMIKLKEEAEAMKQRRVHETVSAWSSEVPPDCDPLPDV